MRGDQGLHGRRRDPDDTKHGQGQRDAVPERESGNGPEELAAARQQHQAEHEEQVIEPCQDVLDAQPNVVSDDVQAAGALRDREDRRVPAHDGLDQPAVGQVDPKERIGLALAQPLDADLRPDQTALAAVGLPPGGQA